jgi:DNA-binding GntR family transcriptional regulator
MPLKVDHVQASLLREQVVEMLRDAILEMRIVPGERVTERQLVESTGVSRATAREALRHLAAEGFVTAVPQRGVVVAAPDRKEVGDIYAARGVLEGLAGRLCARRATKEDVQTLRVRFADLQHMLLDPHTSTAQRLAAKARFYDAMFAIADNPTVVNVLAPLQAKITVLRATSMSQPGRPKQVVKELRAILDAIARHDEDGAFAACLAHVAQAERTALAALAKDGSPAPVRHRPVSDRAAAPGSPPGSPASPLQ